MEPVRRQASLTKAMMNCHKSLTSAPVDAVQPGVCGSCSGLPPPATLAHQGLEVLTLSMFLEAVSTTCLSETLAPSPSSAGTT